MIAPGIHDRFTEVLGSAVRFAEPLERHTSFRIGGPADVWVEVTDVVQIRRVQELAAAAGLQIFLLGGGTNVLVSDRGVRGVVVKLGRAFARLEWQPNGRCTRVRAGAAGSFKRLVTETGRRQLAGLEFAEGIPGTIGGGLLMNAGAFGGETASAVHSVEGVAATGEVEELPGVALGAGYRHTDLPPGFVVTHVNFRLWPDVSGVAAARVAEARQRRRRGQPRGFPNAGSIFKNPPGEFAGRLIEEAGLKGVRHGQAMFSPRHANFIVNLGGATAAEVKALIDEAVARVEARRGIRLEPEVKLVGEWT